MSSKGGKGISWERSLPPLEAIFPTYWITKKDKSKQEEAINKILDSVKAIK